MKPNSFQADSGITFGFTGTISAELSRDDVGRTNESAAICVRFSRSTIRAFVQHAPDRRTIARKECGRVHGVKLSCP